MKFLILFLMPLSALSRTINCEGIGFEYNRTRVKVGEEKVLIEMSSYFRKGRLSQAEIKYPKPVVRVSFNREDCLVSSSKNIVRCRVNKPKVITFIDRISSGKQRKIEVDSLEFTLRLLKELVLNPGDKLAQATSHLAALAYRQEHKTDFLQINFPLSTGQLGCN